MEPLKILIIRLIRWGQLIGINAKTASCLAARSWSGGRKRILGKGPFDSNCYHVMSRTCGGEVFFDDVEKEALKRVLWRMADFCGVRLVTLLRDGQSLSRADRSAEAEIWLERFAGPVGQEKLLEPLQVLLQQDLCQPAAH